MGSPLLYLIYLYVILWIIDTPSPSHNVPHLDSSEESACGGGDSPSYQPSEFLSSSPQQPPSSTGTTPISMAHHSMLLCP